MSYTDEFWKALEEEEKKKKKKNGSVTKSPANAGGSYSDEFYNEMQSLREKTGEIDDSFLPTMGRFSDDEDIAPVGGLDFFDAGSFSDGFDWHDPLTAVGGTVGDVAMGAAKGLSGLAEDVTDLLLYGASGVSSLFGADDVAYDLKRAAKYDFTNDVFRPAQKMLDKASLLGDTSTAITEGLGYTLGIAATAGLGEIAGLSGAGLSALTTGTTFATGMGSGMSEAYNSGKDVSDIEAATYGVMKGAVEAGTEMLWGGLGKGVNAVGISHGIGGVDDMIANKLTEKITNQTVKSLAKFGIKSVGEGAEEVLAGYGSAIAKKLTYMSEEDIGKLVEDENILESFVVGTLSSAISQSGVVPGMTQGSLKESIKTGRDFVTGNTRNEQTVIDKLVEDRIAEAEKNGEKISGKDKNKILEDVTREMERGYIDTDTIEEILGGDSYKSYKDTIAKEEAIAKEFDKLKNKQGATLEEQARFREVRREYYRNQSEQGKARRTDLKNKLRDDVFNKVKNDRLAESYLEKARLGENFQADLTKYKGAKHEDAAKKTLENAIKAGANNTNRVHDLVDMAAELSSETGYVYDFKDNKQIKNDFIERKTKELAKLEAIENRTAAQNEKIAKLKDLIAKVQNNEVTVNGNVDSNGIVLNLDSAKPLNRIIGHEITHTVEKAKNYDKLRDSLFAYAKSKGVDIDAELAMKALEYEGVQGTTAEAELVADLVGDYLFTDSDYVRTLSTQNRNLAQRIYDEVKYFLTKATKGSKEERELLKVKHEFEKAFRESAEISEMADSETKHSLRTNPPPKETGVAYKVFFVKDGKLYPPMVANPEGADTPMGVWLDADVGTSAPPSKTGRQQVKAGGKGTQGGGGSLAFRPGWHLGDLPRASQFDRVNPETGKKELFPENFVWAEVEYAKDVDYQEEAMSYGYTDNGKFRHAYAGLPRLPENGYYRYRTNPKPDTVPWIITGAMKVNRLLSDAEVNQILEKNGVAPVHRQGGDVGLDKFGFDDSGAVKYSISKTTDGRFVAVVDNDILSNIDTSSWDDTKKAEAKKAATGALKQFSGGIVVDGITRKVNKVSRREFTRSNYTESLYKKDPDVFADKMRAAEVADDIVVVATDWERDGELKHPRNDNFVDFDHGKTLIMSGDAKYTAEVVVGITDTGEAVLYDVVDMTPTTFDIKKEESPTTATTQNAIGDIQGDSSADNVAQKGADVKPMDKTGVVKHSLSNNTAYMDKAIAKNETSFHVDSDVMESAKAVRERIASRMNEIKDKGLVALPEDIEGNTYIANSSYDGTEENTTICPRSLASEAFVDAVSEYLGRPLTVEEQIYISQDLQGRSLTPECTYCYVATDRKAYRAFLGEYIAQRDAVLEKVKANPNADVSRKGELYKEFLNGRKDTNPMYSRFKMWVDAYKNGTPMVEASNLANINKLMGDINSEFGAELKPQITDAMKYAQSASWAKKRVNYVAYNGHILNWKQDRIDKLNSHYGLRMYSFSDFHPAFVLENMQMITDASVRGLKMLGYTKDIDFVEIFAPSGMNINVSTFGFETDGNVYENNIIGAEWEKAKALREQYPNVGVTFVATNDNLVNWALEQDWIDVVIPYHLVRTGAEVAKAFNYTNYTSESADTKTKDWKKGDKKYIAPTEHNNDLATYLSALEKNHLKPRFERFLDNPNYMKLVNESRQPASQSKPVQPVFNEEAAMKALAKLEANGYYQPIGGSVDRMYEIAAEVAENMMQELAPTKYSLSKATDNDYLDAVNRGDTIIEQRMVNEAATANGAIMDERGRKPLTLYHGTGSFGFTKFNDGLIFATNDPSISAGYTNNKGYGRQRNISETYSEDDGSVGTLINNAKNILELNLHQLTSAEQEQIRENLRQASSEMSVRADGVWTSEAMDALGNVDEQLANDIAWVLSLPGSVNENIDDFGGYLSSAELENWLDHFDESLPRFREYLSNHRNELKDTPAWDMFNLVMGYDLGDYAIDVRYKLLRSLDESMLVSETGNLVNREDIRNRIEREKSVGSYKLYGFAGDNPLVIDGKGNMWTDIPVDAFGGGRYSTDSIGKKAREMGYTSVQINDIYDMSMNEYAVNKRSNVFIFFDPNQVKSADPVTYDDSGNVIPLSQRFNRENGDIRYSLSKRGEEFAPIGSHELYGKDFRKKFADEIAAEEDIAPVVTVTNVGSKPVNTPVKNVEADTNIGRGNVMDEHPAVGTEASSSTQATGGTRKALQEGILNRIKTKFAEEGFDFDNVLKNAKNLSTFSTVDNTPQRVMEKSLGYKEGQILSDLTVNQVAKNETDGIKWLNTVTNRKDGLLAQLSKQYHIKPGSKESSAAQMYAEGFYVAENNDIIAYGDAELAKDFPDASVQNNIKGLARDSRIRQFYDDTLAMINESRTRNAYPAIPRLDNYYLHFRAMDDTFSRMGVPFNPNDIRAKDLPTDLNGVTADNKPGQPYFASAKHREGKRTSFDLLGGLERYATSAKNQIYHIDDIQTLRALRNYIADTYGQAHGLEDLDSLSEAEQQERIEEVFDSHLSTFAKFLHEEANVLAGKTSLIDRGVEGVLGRRWITFLDSVRKQTGSNLIGYNLSSSLTNFDAVARTIAKTNKFDFIKAFTQFASNKVRSAFGKSDGFMENNPTAIRRNGADRFYRTPFQKAGDAGYALMGMVDNISTELIVRTKYNELIRKGMNEQQAVIETDKWVSRLMGDRSLGQQPLLFNSKTLGLITQFQLEVRNNLDSMFYDTIQDAKVSNEDIVNAKERNAKTAAKITSTFVQTAVAMHLFGTAFEAVAGYNPTFDIIDVLFKAFGVDDEEEDPVLDNIEEAFLALLDDLPYTSTLTGGRIPISNALPITELITGKDQYGNEKSRWETFGEALPYYVLPGGYGQIKKTTQGLSMFSDDHPVAGSYTDSGNLRFPVEDTFGNRLQAGLFGQYASENARDYFDNGRSPLKEKQIQEYMDVDIPIRDYWEYREGLAGQKTIEDKFDYIAGLDLPVSKKNILINNAVDREENVDLEGYEDFSGYDEFDFATKNPGKYAVSQAVGGFDAYSSYMDALGDITADKDENGKSISGSKKEKVFNYIESLPIDAGMKMILYKSMYDSKEDRNAYNANIVAYLDSRDDISYEDMVTILTELGMRVSGNNVYWD